MRPDLYGGYYLLAELNLFPILVLFFGLGLAIFIVGRERFEGLGYQTSYAALIGDLFLIAAIINMRDLLRRPDVVLPGWLSHSHSTHVFLLCLMVALAVVVYRVATSDFGRSKEWMDWYHDIVVAPVLVYFVVFLLLPLLWLNNALMETVWVVVALVVHAACFIKDLLDGRLPQRQHLASHPVRWLYEAWGKKLGGR